MILFELGEFTRRTILQVTFFFLSKLYFESHELVKVHD